MASSGGPAGVPVARHVGHDHVERAGGVGAVRAGIGQERDDLHIAPERVRPAVAQDQRQHGPGRRGGPDVREVDAQAAEPDAEAGQPGERRLLRRPVEPVRPVGDELTEVAQVGPERPAGVFGRVRPARRAQPRAEVLQRRGRGLRGERLGAGPSRWRRGVWHATHPTGRAATAPRAGPARDCLRDTSRPAAAAAGPSSCGLAMADDAALPRKSSPPQVR